MNVELSLLRFRKIAADRPFASLQYSKDSFEFLVAAANDDGIINEYFLWLKADWDRKAEDGVEIPGVC